MIYLELSNTADSFNPIIISSSNKLLLWLIPERFMEGYGVSKNIFIRVSSPPRISTHMDDYGFEGDGGS